MASNYSYQSQFAGFDNLSTTSAAGPANFNNKWANNQQNQNKVKQDWSAFESLLPTANNNSTPNSEVKKLTDNEMMDLLSWNSESFRYLFGTARQKCSKSKLWTVIRDTDKWRHVDPSK